MILVRFLDLKFLHKRAATMIRNFKSTTLDPILSEEPRERLGRVEDGLKPARDQVVVAEGRLVRDTPELSISIAAALVEEGGAGCVTSSPRPVRALPADSRRR